MLYRIRIDGSKGDKVRIAIPFEAVKLLAANEKGCKAIKQIKKQGSITVITKPADHSEVKEQFEFSAKADKLFFIAKGQKTADIFKNKPVIL